jgi:glycosyltransferase involved in cell wall biosynthesis
MKALNRIKVYLPYIILTALIVYVVHTWQRTNESFYVEDSELVSVIIPTFNRLKYLLNTIQSIKDQTYKNVEIIVVNDNSTDEDYYAHDFEDVTIIHLEKNSKELLGYVSCGYVRNQGIKVAKGKYVAFCDDDDSWLPNKLELQLQAMKKTGCKMSSTEAYAGNGIYDKDKTYMKYLGDFAQNHIKKAFHKAGSKLLDNGFPKEWTLEFLKPTNMVIVSSVIMTKELLDTIGNFNDLRTGKEDYDCWLRALQYTNLAFVEEPSVYYDLGHGDGKLYD